MIKGMIFIAMLWMFGSVFGLYLEGASPGGEEQTTLNILINSKALTATSWMGKITGLVTDLAVWGAIGDIIIWDYSFWKGYFFFIPLEPVRWVILTVCAGFMFGILTAWIRGVGVS